MKNVRAEMRFKNKIKLKSIVFQSMDSDELPRLYPVQHSTMVRSRRSSTTTTQIPRKQWGTVIAVREFPQGVYIDKSGVVRPEVKVRLPSLDITESNSSRREYNKFLKDKKYDTLLKKDKRSYDQIGGNDDNDINSDNNKRRKLEEEDSCSEYSESENDDATDSEEYDSDDDDDEDDDDADVSEPDESTIVDFDKDENDEEDDDEEDDDDEDEDDLVNDDESDENIEFYVSEEDEDDA